MKNIPKKLEKGDTIGIICPSAPINLRARHRIDKAVKTLEELGFKVKLGKYVFGDGTNYVSGTEEERLSDIYDMFSDSKVKMIMCGIGGNHSNQIIKNLDYELVKNNPKIFIGYSDITVLHYALNTQGNLVTYYGPCAATQFGESPSIFDYTLKSFKENFIDADIKTKKEIIASQNWTDEFLNWFEKKDLERARILVNNDGFKWLRVGNATGKALPACIMAINRLAGTKYWINAKNKILFLDVLIAPGELDESLVDAYLHDLKNLDVFEEITGLVISRLHGFNNAQKERLYENILKICPPRYPIIAEFDIGHTDPILTIPYDIDVEIIGQYKKILFNF